MATTIIPDRVGEYVVVFTAFDIEGLSASCMYVIQATPTPPDAVCPATVETTPLTTVSVTASGIDDGRIVSVRWRLLTRPPGSAAAAPAPATMATTRFTPDVAGDYTLEVTVTDDSGDTATCIVLVRALATEGLRVEMSWDTEASDMDTHLLHPMGTGWFDEMLDCYFSNCDVSTGRELEWFMPGVDDNPHLDLDDTSGLGPENINIDRPVPGTYRVGIHAYSGTGTHRVTVRIYCGGSTTMPRRTFGPAPLTDDQFWRVADVQITAGGGCSITDLSGAGGFDINSAEDARSRR
jgi:hypothetical protein